MERLTETYRNDDGTGVSKKRLVYTEGLKKGLPNGYCGAIVTKLADYEDAEEQGLLRKLPCKCGDSLWGIKVYKGYLMAKQGTVREMFFTKDMTLLVVLEHICRSEFGKKIFRTQEETEQAILDMGYVRDEKKPSLFRVKKGV
jgi:hypothetical protein